MRRLLPLALLIAAILFGAALLRRSKESPVRPTPACSDPSTCGTNVPAPAAPTASPTAPPPDRVATRTVQPSPALAAADGAALRAEADRLIAAGKVEEGIDVFRKAVEAAPTAKNHGDFGGLLYRLTAFDEAALHLREAAELEPGNADRWIALANVYYRKVDPGEAWKAEKRAREAEPGIELGRDNEGMRMRKGATAPHYP
jgi:tetratricopeptide (TPR) repeat protein